MGRCIMCGKKLCCGATVCTKCITEYNAKERKLEQCKIEEAKSDD